MNIKILLALVLIWSLITSFCLSFWIYYNEGFGTRPHFYYYHHLCQIKQYFNLNSNVHGLSCSKLTKHYILSKFPYSLWHKESHANVYHNDRIQSQRKLLEVLSDIQEQISIKNILVLLNTGPATFFLKQEKEAQMCPYNFTIRDKCNFVRVNATLNATKSLNISKFDAVINVGWGDTAKVLNKIWNLTNGQPEPLYIYYNLESPLHESVTLSEHNKVVSTFWGNADISLPYGKWIKELVPSNFTIFQPTPLEENRNYAKGKTKMAAWIVSNCQPKNGRMDYVLELRKYIQVDIFGSCSPEKKSCNPNCLKLLKKDYKFYIAFENANCRDYITEKFYKNSLRNDVVPIVMGAHPDDYKAVAPHNSYIHVEDFESPESLAQYLIMLNENDELYNRYFEWRKTGQFVETFKDFFCRSCGMTIYSEYQPMPKWAVNSTLKQEDYCQTEKSFYWNRYSNYSTTSANS